jgi:integrase
LGVTRGISAAYTTTLLGEQPDGRKARLHHTAALARKPVGAITTEDVLAVLRPLWTTQFPTADRLRGRLEDVFDYARGRGLVPTGHQNPARWKSHLKTLLPARNAVHQVAHQAMVDWKAAPELMAALRAREGLSARGIELTALTALRTNDVLTLRFRNVDFASETLTIEKTKMGTEHIVPMAPAVVDLLRPLVQGLAPDARVFPIGATAMRKALKAMADGGHTVANEMTVHGLRATFRTWAGDTGVALEVADTRSPTKCRAFAGLTTAQRWSGSADPSWKRGRAISRVRRTPTMS